MNLEKDLGSSIISQVNKLCDQINVQSWNYLNLEIYSEIITAKFIHFILFVW